MDLIDREQALGCFWNYANDDGTGYDETDMPAYDRLQALPIVAEVEDCISRQDAIDALKRDEALVRAFGYHNAIDAIRELPSAQPDVIHCKDCKHHDGTRCFRWNSTIITGLDDFCSSAERRQDE